MSIALLAVHTSHWLAAILLLGVAVYCLRFCHRPMVLALTLFCSLSGLWAFCSALIFITPDLATKIAINRIKLIAPVVLPLSILAMAITIHGRRTWSKYVVGALSIIPIIGLVLLATPYHELLVGYYNLFLLNGHELLAFGNGPWFFFHNLNARSIALTTIILLLAARRDFSPVHRYRIWLVILAIAIPFLGDTIAVHFVPLLRYMQLTPTLLLISAALLIYAIVGKHLVDVVPFARARILDSLGDIYLVFNEDGELIDLNAKAKVALEISSADIGRRQQDIANKNSAVNGLLSLDLEHDCEWLLDDRVYEVSLHSLEVPGTEQRGQVIACKDITLRKMQEQSLKNLNDIRTRRLAVIGHDFQGNLAATLIVAQNLSKNLEAMAHEDIKEACSHLERTTSQNISLIDELLDWAKHRLGASPSRDLVNLNDLADNAYEFLKPMEREYKVKLDFKVDSKRPIVIDAVSLRTVLRNLATNAIKASPKHATVRIVLKSVETCLTLMVEDEGRGIARDHIPELFQLKKGCGSGVGLFLCKEIVSSLGGTISVTSKVGSGSRFTVSILLPEG